MCDTPVSPMVCDTHARIVYMCDTRTSRIISVVQYQNTGIYVFIPCQNNHSTLHLLARAFPVPARVLHLAFGRPAQLR